jgi:hypothetical protein
VQKSDISDLNNHKNIRQRGDICISPLLSVARSRSSLVNGLGGALGRAGAAGQALVRIDLEMQIAHGDSFGGALSRAGTTGQAIIGNNKSHGETSVSIWPIRAFVRCIVTHKSQKSNGN